MQRLWSWLRDPKNQKTLVLLGGGFVTIVGACWTVYLEFFQPAPPSPLRAIENACGVGIGGGDVTVSGINCTFGITVAEYEAGLARHEKQLRAELEIVAEDSEQRSSIEQDLSIVRKRIADVESAFNERNSAFAALAGSLEKSSPSLGIGESFEDAVETGDTSDLEDRLRSDLASNSRRAADRAYQLGILLRQKGQFAEAYKVFQKATLLAPDDTPFQEALAETADQLDILLGNGRLRLSAVLAEGGDPVEAQHSVYEAEADLDGNRRRIEYRDGKAEWFTLSAGRYFVTAQSDLAKHSQFVDVLPGRDVNTVLALNAGRLRLSAVLAEGDDPVEARLSIYEAEADLDGNRKTIEYRDGKARWFTLSAGRYFVTAQSDLAQHSQFVDVLPGRDVNTVLALNAGRLRLSAVLAEGGDPVEARLSVYEAEADLDGNRRRIEYRDGKAEWFTLSAGRYFVTAQSDLAKHSQFVDVLPGRDVNTVLALNAGRLRLSAVLAEGGDPVEARLSVYEAEADLDGNRRRIEYRDGKAQWFTLSAGRYFVTAQSGLAKHSQFVDVLPGRDVNTVLALNAGRLRLSAVLAEGGDPVEAQHSIYEAEADLDGNRRRIEYRDGKAQWFTLSAGRYFVVSHAGNQRAGEEVNVLANKTTNIVLKLSLSPN